jgi:hypothetical protein
VNTTNQTLMSILDAARWAPSGDNTQPWRFEVLGDHKVVVHGYDTREHCVYDLEGEASQLSHGCLLETMRIAASEFGWGMRVERLTQHPPERPTFEVTFDAGAGVAPSPLISSIRRRSVQRKPLSTRPLTSAEKSALEASLGPDYSVQWLEGRGQRWAAAKLMFRNAKLRLTMPRRTRCTARSSNGAQPRARTVFQIGLWVLMTRPCASCSLRCRAGNGCSSSIAGWRAPCCHEFRWT